MTDDFEFQRRVAKALSDEIGEQGFALAGSGAIREHGLIDRPTEDIDMFTEYSRRNEFQEAVRKGMSRLEALGLTAHLAPHTPFTDTYAKMIVTDGQGGSTEVDMCADWRDREPVELPGVGKVLDVEDAVANKLDAVIGRGEPRDYLDALSIRRSGRFTDDDLYRMAHEHDDTFSPELFFSSLNRMKDVPDEDFLKYVDQEELGRCRSEAADWERSWKLAESVSRINVDDPSRDRWSSGIQPRKPKGLPKGVAGTYDFTR